jgi:hypothetical protein
MAIVTDTMLDRRAENSLKQKATGPSTRMASPADRRLDRIGIGLPGITLKLETIAAGIRGSVCAAQVI